MALGESQATNREAYQPLGVKHRQIVRSDQQPLQPGEEEAEQFCITRSASLFHLIFSCCCWRRCRGIEIPGAVQGIQATSTIKPLVQSKPPKGKCPRH